MKIRLLLTALLIGVTLAANAQQYPEDIETQKAIDNTQIIGLGGGSVRGSQANDSVRSLITRFYVDQYRHFQDPRSPYFMFLSKDSKLAMGMGGAVRMRGWFDWNGSVPANGFIPMLIPTEKLPTSDKVLKATPAGCALYFTVIGRNEVLGDFMAYIEANFNGLNEIGFQIKKAYATIGDWTIGYAPTTFCDLAAQPPTIDASGPNGMINSSKVLLRYQHDFAKCWTIGGSFEFPKSQFLGSNGFTAKCNDYVPDIAAMGQYTWAGGHSHIRLAGLFRSMAYRNLIAEKNHSVIGWGAHLSGMFKIIRPLSVYAMATYGQGIGNYTNDLLVGAYDLISYKDNPEKMYAPTSLGLTAGAKYNFKSNIFACVALGSLRYLPKERPLDLSSYKYGLYGAANLFWDITPRLRTGVEYIVGKRQNYDGSHGNANRVDALFMLSF